MELFWKVYALFMDFKIWRELLGLVLVGTSAFLLDRIGGALALRYARGRPEFFGEAFSPRRFFFPWSFLFLFSVLFRLFLDLLPPLSFVSSVIFGSIFLAQCVHLFKVGLCRELGRRVQDGVRLRSLYTQIHFLERIVFIALSLTAFAWVVVSFESTRALGTSLLASAGVVGLVTGFAAQKSLSNLFAGFQIAFTQPIRLDDVVVFDGRWGRIEEITLTYVVVCLADWRRLIVPIHRFLEQPFENWTRGGSHLVGYVFLYFSPSFPLDALRAELSRILNQTGLWDKRVSQVQLTEAREQAVEVRISVSAPEASSLFDLRCLVREKLLVWAQKEQNGHLPQWRIQWSPDSPSPIRRST